MNEYVKKGLIVVAIFATGAVVGRFSLPAKVVEKDRIVEKIVEKKVEVKAIEKKNNKVYVKIEKTAPDGTKTVETRITDLSTTEASSNTSSSKDSSTDKSKESLVAHTQQDWLISGIARFNASQLSTGILPVYGGMVQRRIIGPMYVGAFGYNDLSFGLSVGLAF